MLKRLKVNNFKSFGETEVTFPRLAVFFGPNAIGKSNLIEAIQALSRIGTERTLADALKDPIRGYPSEIFRFPSGGLEELLSTPTAQFSLEADLAINNGNDTFTNSYRYRTMVEFTPSSGKLANCEEFLSALTKNGILKGAPAIETDKGRLIIRRQTQGRPPSEEIGNNYTCLSDLRLSSPAYVHIERVRSELSGWQTYYLDPNSMRTPNPPVDVAGIGVNGQDILSFLYKLKSEYKKYYDGVVRTVQTIIPTIEAIDVNLDKKRGTIDLYVRQYGTDYSSRIISEGTLRVLSLCAITVNPWKGSLLAIEEPENGVHPRSIELIARLIASLSSVGGQQVVVTTHSPIFVGEILKIARSEANHDIGLFTFHTNSGETEVRPFSYSASLLEDTEMVEQLANKGEDGLFEGLVMRGLIDE